MVDKLSTLWGYYGYSAKIMKILGFGACMIKGTPFPVECSFFSVAISKLRLNRTDDIQSDIVSLVGFGAPRAKRHIERQLTKARPGIVVIQFGSTDANVPLRKHLGRVGGEVTKNSDNSITWKDLARWRLKTVITGLLRLKPVTAEDDYIAAMDGMVRTALSMNVTPVVISSFPFGSNRSDRFSRIYKDRLKSVMQGLKGAYFMDVYNELGKYPKTKTLCQDGFHISKFSHELIGDLLAARLQEIIETCRGVRIAGESRLSST